MAPTGSIFLGEYTLSDLLDEEGQQALVGRVFVGYDCDYHRDMLYRVDEYDHNRGHPLLRISELTVHPRARSCSILNLDLHREDADVSDLDLKVAAEQHRLSSAYFRFYV